MLGSGEIDPVTSEPRCRSFTVDAAYPGSLRRIAERLASNPCDIVAVHGLDAGDALALATRFDCGWAYRGGQALLWRPPFQAHEVHDRYLPAPPLRPFDRRGLLEVRGERSGVPLALVAASLSDDRHGIRELRFLRTALRRIEGAAVVFLAGTTLQTRRIGLHDLGFVAMPGGGGDGAVYRRFAPA